MLGSGAKLPRTLFFDRGPGFYHRSWGTITGDYESACRSVGFTPWAGSNSKEGPRAQPPDIGDVLLHETAVSWLRREEEKKDTAEKAMGRDSANVSEAHRGSCQQDQQRV